ncbi:entericidin A/B family lipoprotein [Trinickia sp. LjRoot230]
MTKIFWRRLGLIAIALAFAGLAGCNTMAGFGQDVDDAGHAIKKAAE